MSVLRQLSGPACDALLATEGSAAAIGQLLAAGLLAATDHPVPSTSDSLPDHLPPGSPPEYRLRPLPRDLLYAELLRCSPELGPVLHNRASGWFEGRGDVDAAIAHARAAGQVGRAGNLVWSQVRPHPGPAEVGALGRRLALFTAGQVAGHAPLALAAAWHAVETGRPAEPWLALVGPDRYGDPLPGGPSSVAAAVALVRAMDPTGGVRDTRQRCDGGGDLVASVAADARSLLAAEEPGSPWWARASFLAGVAAHLAGDRDRARPALTAGAQRAPAHGSHAVGLRCRAQLTLMGLDDREGAGPAVPVSVTTRGTGAVDGSHPPVDASPSSDTRTPVDDGENPPCSLTGWAAVSVTAIQALALARAGRPDAARVAAEASTAEVPAGEPGSEVSTTQGWVVVQSWVTLARVRLLLHDPAAALALITRADRAMRAVPDVAGLSATLAGTRRAAEALRRAGAAGAPGLTGAELRVLRFLPTHLSYQEIADRLFVSRNTVKTQAIATYRKLGVRSRGAAVAAAIERGLLAG